MKIVIIGGGPGGYSCAIRFAQLGAEVTLIEKNKVGGVCLNEGCIPTKTLLRAADLLYDLKGNARQYGITADNVSIDWNQMLRFKDNVIKKLQYGVTGLLNKNNVSIIKDTATFINNKQVKVSDSIIDFDVAVIAVGAKSVIPAGWLGNKNGVINSSEALSMEQLPQSLCIIGGGVIGCELATAYAAFGVQVSIVEYLDNILTGFDKKQIEQIKMSFKKKGIKLYLSSKVVAIKDTVDGKEVEYTQNGATNSIRAEKVLVAIGRKANIDDLGLECAGIELDKNLIMIDSHSQTTAPNIFAIGDCASRVQLAYVASHQGKQVAEYVMIHKEGKDSIIPQCVFTIPEIAKVGISTDDIDIDKVLISEFPFAASGKAISGLHTDGSVKVVADKESHEILGVSIVGHGATELIAEASLAANKGMTLEDLSEVVHAHPVMSEGLGIAVDMLLGSSIDYPPMV
ncbi:MAG: dihydrolipoyl dehydrogenase [Prevotella sp.]|nr:dihydrolipoyl dehydrogenase [Prevotella sp.]